MRKPNTALHLMAKALRAQKRAHAASTRELKAYYTAKANDYQRRAAKASDANSAINIVNASNKQAMKLRSRRVRADFDDMDMDDDYDVDILGENEDDDIDDVESDFEDDDFDPIYSSRRRRLRAAEEDDDDEKEEDADDEEDDDDDDDKKEADARLARVLSRMRRRNRAIRANLCR